MLEIIASEGLFRDKLVNTFIESIAITIPTVSR